MLIIPKIVGSVDLIDSKEKQHIFSIYLQYLRINQNFGYLYTFSKNDVISSVRKHYCAFSC